MERDTGNDPVSSAWKAEAQPLDQPRVYIIYRLMPDAKEKKLPPILINILSLLCHKV